ncbi:hypothetical protein Gpo141_00003012 [Globisporangium polare]
MLLPLLLYALAGAVAHADPRGELRSHELAQNAAVVQLDELLSYEQHGILHSQQQLLENVETVVLADVRVLYPPGGSVTNCPIHVQYDMVVTSLELMRTQYARAKACIEIDQQALNTTSCYPLQSTKILLKGLSAGVHYMRVLVVDMGEESGSEEAPHMSSVVGASSEVSFTVLEESDFEVYLNQQRQLQREKYQLPPPEHDDLLKWTKGYDADSRDHITGSIDALGDFAGDKPHDDKDEGPPLVVIGVKTSVLHGFAQRQGIRDSWAANAARHRSVRVFFLGCRPVLTSPHGNTSQAEELRLAIEIEKRVFQDLLTSELDCDDSYYHLADKVKEFMHFATTKFPAAPYVMIIDDDAYVRTHELVDLILVNAWPRERLYAGHVQLGEGTSLIRPERDPGHKNYLSEAQYPLPELPPFTYGCHFVVSSDCARFIGRNRHRLKGLAGLDDASVALWLLTRQVHPRNVAEFNNLDSTSCRDSSISLADLSPSAMRIAHANLQKNKPFCTDFDRNTWHKSSLSGFNNMSKTGVRFSTVIQRSADNRHTQVFVNVTSSSSADSGWWTFWHSPATEQLDDLLPELCLSVKQHVLPVGFVCASFASGLRQHMLELVDNSGRNIDAAHLALWAHNLNFVGVRPPPPRITAVYSSDAAPSKSMIECLLSAIYKHNPIRVVDELTFQEQQRTDRRVSSPEVFVFSALDSGLCGSAWEPQCQQAAVKYVQQYGQTSSLIMIAGESWDVTGLNESVLLISSVADVPRKKHVYVPMASMSFSERVNQSPMLLLSRQAQLSRSEPSSLLSSRKFCAYVYARCDRPQREYMFDLLHAMEPVDALGMCQGSARKMQRDHLSGRLNPLYNENAVKIYSQYKFVIAFENGQQSGYITEKIVNAYLAGSIPIYLGHSDSVAQLFNSRSFIDCGRFATLRKCAERVMEVHQSIELYDSMLNEPVIGNVTLFHELFSWHPDVPSSHVAESVAALLQQKS